jgi:glutamyl-tRNA synthetase
MNWSIPKYAHLPLIHGEDGKKLSKRHGAVDIQEFKELGYLRESIINNLILLGWSPGRKEETIEIEEILQLFRFENLSKSSSIFSYEKLNFFNNHFILKDTNYNKLLLYCKNNLILKNYIKTDQEKFFKIFSIYKKNIYFYKKLENICLNYFDINFSTNNNKLLTSKFNILLNEFFAILNDIKIWSTDILEKEIKKFVTKKDIKFILFGKPMRLLLINSENGPSISNILFILGKKTSIKRIKNYITST